MTKHLHSLRLAADHVAHLASEAPVFLMLIGVPGSGKSTFTDLLKKKIQLVVASTDDQIEELARQHGETYSEAFKKLNWKLLDVKFKQTILTALTSGHHLAVDRTNMSVKSRRKALHFFQPSHPHVLIGVNFHSDPKVLEARLAVRAQATGKVIPPHVSASMLKSYSPPTEDEGYDQIINVYN